MSLSCELKGYAYAVCSNVLRVHIVATGLDPDIAYMHGNYRKRAPLALDLMEPLRPLVDSKTLKLLRAHTFEPGDCYLTNKGACRLNPQLARRIVEAIHVDEKARDIVERFCDLLFGKKLVNRQSR